MGNAGGTPFGGGSGKYNGQFGYNGMSPMNTRKRTRFSKLFLIVSLIVSVIFFLLGEVIYRTLITGVNSVVFMGVYFALFGLLLSIGLLLWRRFLIWRSHRIRSCLSVAVSFAVNTWNPV